MCSRKFRMTCAVVWLFAAVAFVVCAGPVSEASHPPTETGGDPAQCPHAARLKKEAEQKAAKVKNAGPINLENTLVWGPGLETHIVTPVRYFFIQAKDDNGDNITTSLGETPFRVSITAASGERLRLHVQQLDRQDGSYIIRFKLYSSTRDLTVELTHDGKHVAQSPYRLSGYVYHEGCDCPVENSNKWLKVMKCPSTYSQIERDLKPFSKIYMSKVVPEVWRRFNQSGSRSLCRYIIKDNKLYRSTMGKHVGFKMFSDAMILSILRKVNLPDMEFYINLGDWPLENKKSNQKPLPILSWCGSDDTLDIIMPTYDITESTLETMGRCENVTSQSLEMPTYETDEDKLANSCRVTLDLMSVQGNTPLPWEKREEKAFWRGRDSRRERLNLVKFSRKNPDLIDAKLTNMFFFKHEKEDVGELVKHVSFFDFFKYKYQINVDGTVAAYRFPYLLAGHSVIFKQESNYYEHFYKDLQPYEHYVPLKADLSDLEEKLLWAKENDDKARQMGLQSRQFVNDHLLAQDVFCYHVILFKKYAKLLKETPVVQDDMEHVPQPADRFNNHCDCHRKKKQERDEL